MITLVRGPTGGTKTASRAYPTTSSSLCFALALWNGKDPILKERLFGLTGPEGNHGEDVKEYYYYLDSHPHSLVHEDALQIPAADFPYADLIDTNRARGKLTPSTNSSTQASSGRIAISTCLGIRQGGRRGHSCANKCYQSWTRPGRIHLLPTMWFRNTWGWGDSTNVQRPRLWQPGMQANGHGTAVYAEHPTLGRYRLDCEGLPDLLFTENETNLERLVRFAQSTSRTSKTASTRTVVHGRYGEVNAEGEGTKVSAHYRLTVAPGQTATLRLRLTYAMPAQSQEPWPSPADAWSRF